MQTTLDKVIEALQQHARSCETAARDATQEALTGESCDKAKNEQAAQIWMIKSEVWLEAEAMVLGHLEPTAVRQPGLASPAPCV